MDMKLTSLICVVALAGCGGGKSGTDSVQSTANDSPKPIPVKTVDSPVCDNTTSELPGCWASSCEPVGIGEGEATEYGRAVISFSDSGELRHFFQSFDNSNCVGPANETEQFFSDITYQLSPRVQAEDEANVDGHIEFTLGESSLDAFTELPADKTVYSTPFDVISGGSLCFDSYLVSFYWGGFHVASSDAHFEQIDYQGCMTPIP